MDSLPLYKATNSNLLQILKKCNDVSFIRALQTSRRLSEIADQAKPRILTTAYLAVFAYYDETEKKVMFDVPYVNKRPRKREGDYHQGAFDEEMEDDEYWFDLLENKADWHYNRTIDDPPVSQLFFRRSHRPCAFHKKMTAEELAELLQLFRFEILAIDLIDHFDNPWRFIIAEEILKLFPYIRGNAFSMKFADTEEQYDLAIMKAREQCHAKELRILDCCENIDYGLDKLKFDWHSLETLEADCLNEDLVHYYTDLITKWEAGQTNIKHLKLRVSNPTSDFQTTFQRGPMFLKTDVVRKYPFVEHDKFHYLHSANRWAITVCCKYVQILFFYDISDCDGCDCQTEFCFKKLMEVIVSRTEYPDVTDWGTVLDKWNAKAIKTMEGLGSMIQELVRKQEDAPDLWNPCNKQ